MAEELEFGLIKMNGAVIKEEDTQQDFFAQFYP